MTHQTPKQLLVYLLTAITALFGGSMAVSADTVTEGFDSFKAGWNSGWTAWELTLPEGWDYSGTANYFSAGSTYKTAAPSIEVSDNNSDTYLITPALEGEFSFYIRNYTKNYQASITAYACTFDGGVLSLGTQIDSKTLSKTPSGVPSWEKVAFTASSATRVALLISRAYFDDFTYTPAEGGEGGDDPDPDPDPDPAPTPDPAPVMEITTTTVNFGKVTANATQDITVSNTGDAELVASITSDNEEFTVTPSAVTVAAGTSETFTITFVYQEEAYGAHAGTITVTPNVGDAMAITVSAYIANPNRWSEEFEGNTLPDGWKADANWTFSDGMVHSQYVHNHNDYLTTPSLLVSGTADQLTFQGRENGIYPAIKIEKSLNGGEWTAFKTIGSDDISEEWQTYTIDGLEAGSYQFRFLSDSYDLDNFEGFMLNQNAPALVVTPTTDAAFGKVSTQPEAITYTITNEGTGTLTGSIVSSDPTQFTVSESEFSLSAGESTTFDIALVLDDQYGAKAATITIHPNNEGLSDVTINATATTLDPNVWAEDFEEGVIPEGWLNEGWSVGTQTGYDNTSLMALAPQSTTDCSLTTPRLVAKKDEVLTWDAYLRWSDEPLLVEYSDDDKATWTTIYNYKAEDEELENYTYKAMSFTAPADGTYYLRFTAKFQNGVDNLRGFQLAPSEEVKEAWYVSYIFNYGSGDEMQEESDTETLEVIFSGDNVTFNFPNPINGNAQLRGTKDGEGNYVFPNGQYIANYGTERAYFCGSDGTTLTDIIFVYDEEKQQFLCTSPILINSSTTNISYWGYFSLVIISKEEPTSGITEVRGKKEEGRSGTYDLQGRKVANPSRGLYIVNGRKVVIK